MSKIIFLRVKEAKSWPEKFFGLIGKKPYPLLLRTHFGIHTFGMQYPLDVLILDSKNQIVKLKENLVPNRFFIWNPRFNTVVELPAGTIRGKRLQKGTVCRFV